MSMPYLGPQSDESESSLSGQETAAEAPIETAGLAPEPPADPQPLPARTGRTLGSLIPHDGPRGPPPTPPAEPAPRPVGTGGTWVSLSPHDGKEPPANLSDDLARAVWWGVSAFCPPSLLPRAAGLPRLEPVDAPSPPAA